VAAELLNGEGFTDVQHQPPDPTGALTEVASGTADIGITFSGPTIMQIDGGDQITILAGVHPGCFELVRDAARPLAEGPQGQEDRRDRSGV
jgi:NitT/TauT family transport system substrate-binding protein